MKRFTPWLILLLVLLPTGFLVYKSVFLKVSLLPQRVDDVWDFHISLRPKDAEATSVAFPIPRAGEDLKISDERIRGKGLDTLIDRNSDSAMLTWLSNEPINRRVSYSARIDILPLKVAVPPKDTAPSYPRQLKKFLKAPVLSDEDRAALEALEAAIFEGSEDKVSVTRKAFYYVSEEIQRNIKFKTLQDALSVGKGSPLIKARLFTYLLRRKGVPVRIVAQLRLPLMGEVAEERHQLTFANEVFLGNRWVPVDTNRGHFGERPDRYLVLHRHFEEIEKTIGKPRVAYTIRAKRAVVNKYNKEEFRKEVLRQGNILAFLSLYRLPPHMQEIFATIMLIPLGTLVLCLARNILGVPTFGMFTPILLTVFFKETSLAFGLFFFLSVVGIGIVERYFLDKLYLLAIPRLSIVLTLVIILLMLVALTGLAEVFGASHIGYFPIVIVTVFIERFSIMLTEDGATNTFKTLLGTLVISVLTYGLYSVSTLEILLFTNPELLLVVIALLILIGKYKGYRVSEFVRFRNLVKQLKERA